VCRTIPGSGKKKIVLYTVDRPYSTKRPGFVSKAYDIEGVQFTDDLWGAQVWDNRNDVARVAETLKRKCKQTLLTHEAIAQLATGDT